MSAPPPPLEAGAEGAEAGDGLESEGGGGDEEGEGEHHDDDGAGDVQAAAHLGAWSFSYRCSVTIFQRGTVPGYTVHDTVGLHSMLTRGARHED